MFDYQAGEKYRLTLIMVGLAGIMAGIFFTLLLSPSQEPVRAHRPMPGYMRNPDITGRRDDAPQAAGAAQAAMAPDAPSMPTDPTVARTLIEQWLPLAWDLSAGTGKVSQDKAMAYMTPECAIAYKQNIWTEDLAKQIDESGLKSTFQASGISNGEVQPDGSVVIIVNGTQTLAVPDKGSTSRAVKLEYMVRQTAEGMRIAGISEGGGGT